MIVLMVKKNYRDNHRLLLISVSKQEFTGSLDKSVFLMDA